VVEQLPRNPVGKVVRAELLRIATATRTEETGR
jgi:acyl-coenzyme A synthetase/AMP-(fatty) acid ligase